MFDAARGSNFGAMLLTVLIVLSLALFVSFIEKLYFKVFKPRAFVDWYSFSPQYWDFLDSDTGNKIGGYVDSCVVVNRSRITVEKIEFKIANRPLSYSLEEESSGLPLEQSCEYSEREDGKGIVITVTDVKAGSSIKLSSQRQWPEKLEGVQSVKVNGVAVGDKFEHKIVDLDAVVIPSNVVWTVTTVFILLLTKGVFELIVWLEI